MKPSALRIERLLATVEAELACRARPRRYCFDEDELAEAKASFPPLYWIHLIGTFQCNQLQVFSLYPSVLA